MKQTTKCCPKCGNEKLALFTSLNAKYCPDCYTWMDWYLEPGQRSIFMNIIGERDERKV